MIHITKAKKSYFLFLSAVFLTAFLSNYKPAMATTIDLKEYMPIPNEVLTTYIGKTGAIGVRWSDFINEVDSNTWWRFEFSKWPGHNYYDTLYWAGFDNNLHYADTHSDCDAEGNNCRAITTFSNSVIYGPRFYTLGATVTGSGASGAHILFANGIECSGNVSYTWGAKPYQEGDFPANSKIRTDLPIVHTWNRSYITYGKGDNSSVCDSVIDFGEDWWWGSACVDEACTETQKTWVYGKGGKMPNEDEYIITFNSIETPPAIVTGLKSTCSETGTTVTLSWDNSAGAKTYDVRLDDLSNDWIKNCSALNSGDFCANGVNTNSRIFTITPGANYSWWVFPANPVAGNIKSTGANFSCPAKSTPAPPAQTPPPTTDGTEAFVFKTNLKLGMRADDVKQLQKFLNAQGFKVATSGAGSPGSETTSFGLLTKAAVIKFQEFHKSEVLTPAGLSGGTGYVGLLTRAKINKIVSAK